MNTQILASIKNASQLYAAAAAAAVYTYVSKCVIMWWGEYVGEQISFG